MNHYYPSKILLFFELSAVLPHFLHLAMDYAIYAPKLRYEKRGENPLKLSYDETDTIVFAVLVDLHHLYGAGQAFYFQRDSALRIAEPLFREVDRGRLRA